MKWIKLLFLPLSIFTAVSCNKAYKTPSTPLPEELSHLKGKWKVVDFYHDNGWSIDTTTSLLFNQMEFDTK